MTPPVLTGSTRDGFCDLSWAAVVGAVKYRVRRGIPPAPATQIASGTFLTYTNPTQNGTEYEYQVVAVDSAGGTAKSNFLRLKPTAPPPLAAIVGRGSGTTGGGPTVTHMVDTGN